MTIDEVTLGLAVKRRKTAARSARSFASLIPRIALIPGHYPENRHTPRISKSGDRILSCLFRAREPASGESQLVGFTLLKHLVEIEVGSDCIEARQSRHSSAAQYALRIFGFFNTGRVDILIRIEGIGEYVRLQGI